MYSIAQSNPSFEIWLYYHFYEKKPNADEVAQYNTFKEYVGKQITGGFDYEKDPVQIEKAIINSKANTSRDAKGNLTLYSTEVYQLADKIVALSHKDLNTLKRMM